jgi:hypothetical protein
VRAVSARQPQPCASCTMRRCQLGVVEACRSSAGPCGPERKGTASSMHSFTVRKACAREPDARNRGRLPLGGRRFEQGRGSILSRDFRFNEAAHGAGALASELIPDHVEWCPRVQQGPKLCTEAGRLMPRKAAPHLHRRAVARTNYS